MSKTPQHIDRRPIKAREWRLSQSIAESLARKGISPNAISVAGAIFGILGGTAFALTNLWPNWERLCWLTAAVMIQLRLQCNLYDGMVALATGRASPVGELYNDVPDRVSDTAFIVGLGYATGGNVELGFASAIAAILTAYVRAVGKATGANQEFCGPMAKQQRMALLTVLALYCAFVTESWRSISLGAMVIAVPSAVLAVILVGSMATVVRRLLRIVRQLEETARES